MPAPLIEPVARLIEALARLPGIGPKTAQRLTYYMLRAPDAEASYIRKIQAALLRSQSPRPHPVSGKTRRGLVFSDDGVLHPPAGAAGFVRL